MRWEGYVMAEQQGSRNGRRSGRGGRRDPLPALADRPILEKLDEVPSAAPKSSETPHDKARRAVIAAEGQWVVLNTRAALNEASARRLVRSYQRAKPARLVQTAAGRFLARPFVRNDTWLVAVAYQPSDGSDAGAAG